MRSMRIFFRPIARPRRAARRFVKKRGGCPQNSQKLWSLFFRSLFRSSLLSFSRETTALLVFAAAFGWRFFDLSSFLLVFSFSARTSVSVFVALVAQRSLFFDLFGLFLWSPPRVVVFFTSGKTQKNTREEKKNRRRRRYWTFSLLFLSTQRTTPRDARRRQSSSWSSSSSRSAVVARRFFFSFDVYARGRLLRTCEKGDCVCVYRYVSVYTVGRLPSFEKKSEDSCGKSGPCFFDSFFSLLSHFYQQKDQQKTQN